MQHTKRSYEFKRKIDEISARLDKLIDACLGNRPELGDFLAEIKVILQDNTTDSGCVVGAREGEQIFTLRSKDKLFLTTLRFWIDQARAEGLHADKLDDAEECYREALFRTDTGVKSIM